VKFTAVQEMRILFVMATSQEYGPELRARIDPLISGVGPIEASLTMASCLQQMRDCGEPPNAVVSLGSAGSRICELGTVYQVSEVSWRDIDATRLGFPKGVTPFVDCPACINLPTPLAGIPAATLSTGANVLGGDDYADLGSAMADMETFAVLRACERFKLPMVGLRGISDGPGDLNTMSGWTDLLGLIDSRLAEAVDVLLAHLNVVAAL